MVTLIIMDGFGLSDKVKGNAILQQGTPNLNKLNNYPYAKLIASGKEVGLTDGQMGNSEVGHLNLGAGRVVFQDLPKINNSIESGEIRDNVALNQVFNHTIKNNSTLHFMGLLSDGGVHSHIDHLIELINIANSKGVSKIVIHAITDGRDTLRDSGVKFIETLQSKIVGKAVIGSVIGRIYAMDREQRWDRVEKAYSMLIDGSDNVQQNLSQYLTQGYSNGIYDEFVESAITNDFKAIEDGDGFIFFNYRTDRAREITQAITQGGDLFENIKQKQFNNLVYCCLTEYSQDFKGLLTAFPPEKITNNLSSILSQSGKTQLHITESTKYAHVTFFFNGGIEKQYQGEDRILIESENVKDFADSPAMKCREITDTVIEKIKQNKYDFILINLSNPDMIGHTGNMESAIKAIEIVDECAYQISQAVLQANGHCIITADHGNAEEMLDDNGNVLTQHTTNPVPVWLVSNQYKEVALSNGKLSNVAPTILKLLNIEKPTDMDSSLF